MPVIRLSLALFWLLLAGAAAAQATRLESVRISSNGERTRVVVDLDRPAEHKLFVLQRPDRVVIDVPDARFDLGGRKIPAGAGVVANIRAANRDNGMARLVLDMSASAQPNSFLVPPGGNGGNRLVIDLVAAANVAAAPSAAAVSESPKVVKRAPQFKNERDLIIAIDPGHGGKDPGARGHGGLLEKNAVLAISKRLATDIDNEPGMRSFLTRSDDRFLHLRERIRRSRAAGADLFISIHADAFTDRRVNGSTVYVLSSKGATDEAAALLAQRENDADLIGGAAIADKDDVLASVLVDLSQTESLEASIEAGNLLIGEMSRVGKVRKTSVQQAGFRVLKAPDIPSMLVETAFISNPQDENNLRSVQYQQRLSKAMLNGIRAYFYANPPPGTMVARLSKENIQPRRYVIRNGDTLSEIAERHNVSVSQIRAANRLQSSTIRAGQVLQIPPSIDT